MTIYYTAKDIEELAARGVEQLEVGAGVTLTDFARETARQLNIALVNGATQVSPPAAAAAPPAAVSSPGSGSGRYNKPSGCQHGPVSAGSPSSTPASQAVDGASANTMNRLIDLMGKAIKRGD